MLAAVRKAHFEIRPRLLNSVVEPSVDRHEQASLDANLKVLAGKPAAIRRPATLRVGRRMWKRRWLAAPGRFAPQGLRRRLARGGMTTWSAA
jgi:hypothetical protein